jgi:putative restriction endonuclease
LAEKQNTTIQEKYQVILSNLRDVTGRDILRQVKTRVNQSVFRQIVMANFSGKCAITGIDVPELLFASHIVPWGENEQERLNPENGICLSALYDKAFDAGLIGVSKDYKILLIKVKKRKSKILLFSTFRFY